MELTPEQLEELKSTLKEIGAYLPENKTNYIWNTYKTVTDSNEMQPCTCASAGGHWKRAVDFLHNYIKEK
jgi:hypothetical protein